MFRSRSPGASGGSSGTTTPDGQASPQQYALGARKPSNLRAGSASGDSGDGSCPIPFRHLHQRTPSSAAARAMREERSHSSSEKEVGGDREGAGGLSTIAMPVPTYATGMAPLMSTPNGYGRGTPQLANSSPFHPAGHGSHRPFSGSSVRGTRVTPSLALAALPQLCNIVPALKVVEKDEPLPPEVLSGQTPLMIPMSDTTAALIGTSSGMNGEPGSIELPASIVTSTSFSGSEKSDKQESASSLTAINEHLRTHHLAVHLPPITQFNQTSSESKEHWDASYDRRSQLLQEVQQLRTMVAAAEADRNRALAREARALVLAADQVATAQRELENQRVQLLAEKEDALRAATEQFARTRLEDSQRRERLEEAELHAMRRQWEQAVADRLTMRYKEEISNLKAAHADQVAVLQAKLDELQEKYERLRATHDATNVTLSRAEASRDTYMAKAQLYFTSFLNRFRWRKLVLYLAGKLFLQKYRFFKLLKTVHQSLYNALLDHKRTRKAMKPITADSILAIAPSSTTTSCSRSITPSNERISLSPAQMPPTSPEAKSISARDDSQPQSISEASMSSQTSGEMPVLERTDSMNSESSDLRRSKDDDMTDTDRWLQTACMYLTLYGRYQEQRDSSRLPKLSKILNSPEYAELIKTTPSRQALLQIAERRGGSVALTATAPRDGAPAEKITASQAYDMRVTETRSYRMPLEAPQMPSLGVRGRQRRGSASGASLSSSVSGATSSAHYILALQREELHDLFLRVHDPRIFEHLAEVGTVVSGELLGALRREEEWRAACLKDMATLHLTKFSELPASSRRHTAEGSPTKQKLAQSHQSQSPENSLTETTSTSSSVAVESAPANAPSDHKSLTQQGMKTPTRVRASRSRDRGEQMSPRSAIRPQLSVGPPPPPPPPSGTLAASASTSQLRSLLTDHRTALQKIVSSVKIMKQSMLEAGLVAPVQIDAALGLAQSVLAHGTKAVASNEASSSHSSGNSAELSVNQRISSPAAKYSSASNRSAAQTPRSKAAPSNVNPSPLASAGRTAMRS